MMIKKLTNRFIFVTMTIITLFLIVAFSSLIISTQSKMKSDGLARLDNEYARIFLKNNISFPPPGGASGGASGGALGSALGGASGGASGSASDGASGGVFNPIEPFDNRLPFFTFFIQVDESGSSFEIQDMSGLITQDVAQEAFEVAQQKNTDKGSVPSLNFRYKTYDDHVIGFVDYTYSKDFINKQIITYSIVFVLSWIGFFIISIFLSKITVRPIDQAWKKQQQFIGNASHELKTPITVILANTSILLSDLEDSQKKNKKWITNIDNETLHMKKLVEDLLFLARVDDDSHTTIQQTIDLSDVVFQSTLPFEPVYYDSGHNLITDIQTGITLKGNEMQIKQLISILLDNAKKYSYPSSNVVVKLIEQNNFAVLTIKNMCNPISQEDMEHLFDRFYMADESRTRKGNSFGLGLSIAKEIASIHKGKITAQCSDNNTTTFTVSLPLT